MNDNSDTNIPQKFSIALIDDHEVVLEGMRSFLRRHGYDDVRTFRTAHDLLTLLAVRRFDLYIIDVELPDMDGGEFIDALLSRHAGARIVVNTMHEELWVVKTMQEKNVDAVVYKSTDLSQMLRAIEAVRQGRQYFCPEFQRALMLANTRVEHPSKRESDVLHEIAKGFSTKEIAARLYISENTVEKHRQNLFTKLSAHNMADLMVKAIARGYINPQDIDDGHTLA